MKKINTPFLFLQIFLCTTVTTFSQSYQWARVTGGNQYDVGTAIAIDATGNIYYTGTFSGTADFDPGPSSYQMTSAGSDDIFVSKLDAAGKFLWAKRMGGINNDFASAITLDASGNVYTTGNFGWNGDFDPDQAVYTLQGDESEVFISKLDQDGNFIWAKSVGGQYDDYSNSITIDISGNVYTTGHFEGGGDFDPGSGIHGLYSSGGYNIFILKLDASGSFVWVKGLGGLSNAEGLSITTDKNGNVYSAGNFNNSVDFDPGSGEFKLTSAGENDIYILKLSASGDFIWAKSFGGNGNDGAASIVLDNAENIYTTGTFSGVSDFDPGNNVFEIVTNGSFDIFISKLDADGNFAWAKSIGGSDSEHANSMVVDATGNIFLSGIFKAVANLDPGDKSYLITSLGGFDTFILRLTNEGDFVWCDHIGGVQDESLTVAIDVAGTVYGVGYLMSESDIKVGNADVQLPSFGATDIILIKVDQVVTGIEKYQADVGLQIFPNPINNEVKIKIDQTLQPLTYTFTDQIGKLIASGSLQFPITSIDAQKLESGMYYIKIIGLSSVIKIVKQ